MPGKEATASRRGGSAGIRSNRARRLDGRAWRDVSRAIHLGKKKDLYSVEVHGVRAVFKKSAPHIVENSRRTSKPGMPASRQHVDPASAPTANLPRPPNSAKRRSARRMQNHIKELQGTRSQKATTHPKTTTPKAERPAPVETDVRMDDAPAETAAKGHRGQKRATVEPMEHAHKPKAAAAAKQSPQPQQQQQKRPAVESTARLTEAAAKQPVAATKQPQQQQKQGHAAETAAQPAAAAVTAVTSTAPAAALGQMLKMTGRGILRPNGTVDNTDWKCMGCGESEVNGTSSGLHREGCIVLLGCKCKYPKWQARKRPLLDL
jgi:hypothetical protein